MVVHVARSLSETDRRALLHAVAPCRVRLDSVRFTAGQLQEFWSKIGSAKMELGGETWLVFVELERNRVAVYYHEPVRPGALEELRRQVPDGAVGFIETAGPSEQF